MRRDIEFKSEGQTCRGWLFTPDKGKGPFPGVVTAMGAGYVKEFPIMLIHAEEFVRRGMATIIFDYRHFGASDGQPRQHLDPQEQIEDCRNAISLAETLPEVDPQRIGFCGVSVGGAHALVVAAVDPRIKCVVSVVPTVDGYVLHRLARGDIGFKKTMDLIMDDRRKRFKDENLRGYIPNYAEPDAKPGGVTAFPEPEHYHVFMSIKKVAPAYENRRTIEGLENQINYRIWPYLERILDMPVLVSIIQNDTPMYPFQIEAYNRIPSPNKKCFILPDEGGKVKHLTVYSDAKYTKIVAEKEADFLADYLVRPFSK
ncbi:MAG: acetylxylan esterase [Chloroflexi bacterium]|nr:acetylxylan esterase [Chloroflexota bacterium]